MDVAILPGRTDAKSHRDLNVWDWVCGVPDLATYCANVAEGRRTFHQGSGARGVNLPASERNGDTYTVIHYDQVSIVVAWFHFFLFVLPSRRSPFTSELF